MNLISYAAVNIRIYEISIIRAIITASLASDYTSQGGPRESGDTGSHVITFGAVLVFGTGGRNSSKLRVRGLL